VPSLLDRLGSLLTRGPAGAVQQATQAAADVVQGATQARGGTAQGGAGGAAALSDPVVSNVNQQLASEQPQPVPTEDDLLQQEQHTAWANYDFERCIVIFSRLLELHPDDPTYKEKLVHSYYNRGKQYEAEGNDARATQLYYSALAIDADFQEAKDAAEALLNKHNA
jgi:tetratricopeptide (TPR) repeat protein